jgi:hypothetical protein
LPIYGIDDLKAFETPAGTLYSKQKGPISRFGSFLSNEVIYGAVVLVPHGQKGKLKILL